MNINLAEYFAFQILWFITFLSILALKAFTMKILSLADSFRVMNLFTFLYFFFVPRHGVQRRMISVDNFFIFLKLLFFALLLLYVT